MQILFDNIIYSLQKAGGISVVWTELIKRTLDDPDINPHFIDEPNQNLFRNQIEIPKERILSNPLTKYPMSLQRYLNLHIKNKGIFHSSYYRIAKGYHIVNVTTVHDFTYEYYRKGLARFIHSTQKANAIKNAQRIICVSENTKRDLLKFYPGINEQNIHVIYNGVDDGYYPISIKNEKQIKHIIPFSSNEFALFIGDRKSNYKNFEITVKACKKADVPLVIVGGGQITRLENDLLERNLRNSHFVHLSGINNIQLNILYNYALCLIYPSLYEGFGIPVVEAQRAGCPVISTKYSSIPEIAGKGAVLLNKVTDSELAESINQIKCDSEMTDSLKAKGFQNSQRFSWDKTYQQSKDVYKEIYEKYL